ncbi:Arginine biosynthesis bifunctional protein ArgJ [Gracilariopsis chorda]|uniref:Arginine biosynthesis bifunctional protein ArgJ, mitochondrial n=1 Tax=Gracilariopsis chorda TaxID=448386 RepID=A0A2V3J3T5_9FLOR|nr:Arginine biosynthesis bifunctional protein ArgJ [Gracilariopsis chorda]|eukprot:PXF49055.1 Arginine biosynthesis bifunctional protein ArgJ [Gracilariopsis chorda]
MITQIENGGVTAPKGFKAAGYTAGFKPSGLPDLAVIVSEDHSPLPAAALFTKNIVRAAPVEISEENMTKSNGKIAAIVLNSGQANAGTGAPGHQDGLETVQVAADALGCQPENIFICSTGVIGKRFDIEKMKSAIPTVLSAAKSTLEGGFDAAKAIMTTDLRMKQTAFQDTIAGKTVTVGGMCKGSGMIHPEMATMLGVISCDASVGRDVWQKMLKKAVDKSFNAITVDGDSSTNDVVCGLCSGASGLTISQNSAEADALQSLLDKTCMHLAKSIARDGEGATVLIEVQVKGAVSDEDATRIARTVTGSSLVKAAIFGHDPNWGRIAAAAGRARADFDVSKLKISLGDHLLMEHGNPVPFDAVAASSYMKEKAEASAEHYLSDHDTVLITIEVGNGPGEGVAWGCDLSYKYVEINAEYTT